MRMSCRIYAVWSLGLVLFRVHLPVCVPALHSTFDIYSPRALLGPLSVYRAEVIPDGFRS